MCGNVVNSKCVQDLAPSGTRGELGWPCGQCMTQSKQRRGATRPTVVTISSVDPTKKRSPFPGLQEPVFIAACTGCLPGRSMARTKSAVTTGAANQQGCSAALEEAGDLRRKRAVLASPSRDLPLFHREWLTAGPDRGRTGAEDLKPVVAA